MEVINSLKSNGLLAGVIVGKGVRVLPSPAGLFEKIKLLVEKRKAEDFPPADLKESVRRLLRSGGFKASGRNKPASEYLAQAAREGRFPAINNLVDIVNFISLSSGLPISLLDLGATSESVIIRHGSAGESFVFNAGGQIIDLEGLIVVCRREGPDAGSSIPLGTPVKDSMQGKIKDSTTSILGIVYGPPEFPVAHMQDMLVQFKAMVADFGFAEQIEYFAV